MFIFAARARRFGEQIASPCPERRVRHFVGVNTHKLCGSRLVRNQSEPNARPGKHRFSDLIKGGSRVVTRDKLGEREKPSKSLLIFWVLLTENSLAYASRGRGEHARHFSTCLA